MTNLLPAARGLADRLGDVEIPLTVRGISLQCWRCGVDDVAVGLVHISGSLDVFSVVLACEGTPLAYARDLLGRAGDPRAVSIKVRRSRSAQGSYLSSGCRKCDALYGASGLAEDLAGRQANEDLDSLPVLVETVRPEIEWALLAAERDGLYNG